MAGAYMAKAPAAVVDPGYPPGWADYPWPFPGPYPPGYTPTLSLLMTATDTIAFDGTASVTGSARDQDTYATNEPSAITWIAQDQDGNVVNLRFNGGSSYSSSISSSVSFGTYWGATPSIEFELTEDNADDVITLTGYYTLDEIQVVQTEDITIGVILSAVLTWGRTLHSGSDDFTGQLQIIGQESQYDADGRVAFSEPGGVTSTSESLPDISATAVTLIGTITVNTFLEEVYDVGQIWYAGSGPVDVTATITLTMTVNGEETEYTKSVRLTDDETHASNFDDGKWLEIDGTDGTVTIINP